MINDTSKLLPSQRLRIAFLLTLTGGYLDAYTYFVRGGVFANAQTGNIVKLAIELANREGTPKGISAYLIPICAFAVGLVAVRAVGLFLQRRNLRFVRRLVLAVEALGLCVVALVPLASDWDIVANSIVSFIAAMQYEAFGTFHGEAIATTMSTGNLKKMVDGLFVAATEHDRERLRQAAVFGLVILCFCAGAFLGTRCCALLARTASLPAILPLAVAAWSITVMRRRNLST